MAKLSKTQIKILKDRLEEINSTKKKKLLPSYAVFAVIAFLVNIFLGLIAMLIIYAAFEHPLNKEKKDIIFKLAGANIKIEETN